MGLRVASLALAVVAAANAAAAQDADPGARVLVTEDAIHWGEGPRSLPKGARAAILSGDPGQPGPYTIRVQFPAGYRLGPHWHSGDEHVTVLAGMVMIGDGDRFDEKAMRALRAGAYTLTPAGRRHYAYTKDGVTFQAHGIGPVSATYVDAKDDPRTAAAQ